MSRRWVEFWMRGRYGRLAIMCLCLLAIAVLSWQARNAPRYLSPDTTGLIVSRLEAPPAADSSTTREEIDELLRLQQGRTEAQTAAARADRKKDVSRFFGALGFDERKPPDVPNLTDFLDQVESDIGPYVRAAKQRFKRLRPYEIEPRIAPCIDNVRGDQSYPSGHATYGYVMTLLLANMVPERRDQLLARGEEFARQRMVCGVHFRSDIVAGKLMAQWLVDLLARTPDFARDEHDARKELRDALGLPEQQTN